MEAPALVIPSSFSFKMYGFKHFAAIALALIANTQADRLAVIKTVAQIETGSAGMGSKWCYERGSLLNTVSMNCVHGSKSVIKHVE